MYKFNTLFIGQNIKLYPSLESTNDEAKALLISEKLPEGTIVLTENQTKGRGQMGNRWWSEPKQNLTFSIVLYPSFLKPPQQFLLTQCISSALRDVVQNLILNEIVKVKWPNDLYVGRKKIAGLLIENILSGNKIQSSIIGIGLNVNQQQFQGKIDNPTSLSIESGRSYDLQNILESLCVAIEKHYIILKGGKWKTVRSNYLNGLFRLSEIGQYKRKDGTIFNGKIVDVTLDGLLVMEVDGKKEQFINKQIEFVK